MGIDSKMCKYIFIDIVGYSKKRTVEAQCKIIESLNGIVSETLVEYNISQRKRILIPTGDGICIALINYSIMDLHVVIALSLLGKIKKHNELQTDDNLVYEVRVGINENMDNMIIDVNGRKNIAGSGINYAQRLMSLADGNMIMLGTSVHDQLNRREKYFNKFKEWRTVIKHGELLSAYQYIDETEINLNCRTPSMFLKKDTKKEINYNLLIKIYLAILIKGESVISNLVVDVDTSHNMIVLLYYLVKEVVDHYNNSKKTIKEFAGDYDGSIKDEGRIISLTEGVEILKSKVDDYYILRDLKDLVVERLVEKSNARELFRNAYSPLEIKKDLKGEIMEKCSDQLEFIKKIE